MGKNIRLLFICLILAVIAKSGCEIYKISSQYVDESDTKNSLAAYRPDYAASLLAGGIYGAAALGSPAAYASNGADAQPAGTAASGSPNVYGSGGGDVQSAGEINSDARSSDSELSDTRPADGVLSDSQSSDALIRASQSSDDLKRESPPHGIVNQSIIDMQNEVNEDVIGWLTIPDTKIDYPIVASDDNGFYLKRNIYKEYSTAGSIFLDSGNSKDLSDFNTIIYGHNMKNMSMFGDLPLFANEEFFENNRRGVLFTEGNTYLLEIFAFMVVRYNDATIYNASADRDEFYGYVAANAMNYREPIAYGRVVTLSTCSYEFNNARSVLLANLVSVYS